MKKFFSFFVALMAVGCLSAKTLYLQPSDNWKEANARFAIYAFGAGDTWYDLVAVTDHDGYYSADVDDKYTTVIFCRMNPTTTENNWDNKWTQTGDMTIENDNDLCIITGWDAGTWSKYVALEPEPEPETHWYLNGSFNSWGDGFEFAAKEDGEEGLLYTTVSELAIGEYEFKIHSTGASDEWYGNNGIMTSDNCSNWPFYTGKNNCRIDVSVAGDYEFVLNPASVTLSVIYPTPAPEPEPEPEPEPKFKWFVAGDFDDWHAEMLDEKPEGAEHVLYLSKYLPAGKELAFKVLQGENTWYSANGLMSIHYHEGWGFSASEGADCRLATTIAGTYEFAFDTINAKMTVSYPFNPKQATLYDSPVKDNNTDVMLQAFYWAHDIYGNDITTFGNVRWAVLNDEAGEIAQNFDLVWLAPSQETADYTGYLPMNYSKQGVAQEYSGHHGHAPWGTASDLRNLIDNLHQGGAKVVADIVLNHTCAGHVDEYAGEDKNWCSWELNDFGRYGQFQIDRTWITAQDEMFATDYQYGRIDRGATGDCGDYNTALLTPDEKTVSYQFGTFDWAYSEYNSTYSRDLAHGKKEVQEMSRAYLTWMRDSIGYDGFRFDFMKGIAGWHLAEYNNITAPYFCVAEVFDGDIDKQLGFLYDAQNTTYLFDFPGKFTYYNDAIRKYDLKNLKSDYSLIRRNPKHTVTFIDNHDSFNEEGKSLYGEANTMDDRQVHQALAFQLSMPGVPCIFYPYWHFYKDVCKAFIHARKAAGVHSESTILGEWVGSGAEGNNYYTALIQGTKGQLFVKLGYDCVPTDAPMAAAPAGQKWVCAWANREHAGVWYTEDSGSATAVDNTESDTKVTKFFRDGQIYIQRGEHVYTVEGMQVK